MTTPAQLIEILRKLPKDLEILVSKDPEGNSFHGFDDIGVYFVEKSTSNSFEQLFDDDDLSDEDADFIERNFKRVAVIWPA